MHSKHTATALCAGFAAGIAFIVACSTRTATNRPGLSGNDAAVVRLDGGMRDARMAHDATSDSRAVDAGRDAHAQAGCTYEYLFVPSDSLPVPVGATPVPLGGNAYYPHTIPDGWELLNALPAAYPNNGGVVLRRCMP